MLKLRRGRGGGGGSMGRCTELMDQYNAAECERVMATASRYYGDTKTVHSRCCQLMLVEESSGYPSHHHATNTFKWYPELEACASGVLIVLVGKKSDL